MLDRGPTPWLTERPAEIGIRGIGWYLGERLLVANMPSLLFDPATAEAFQARGYRYYTRSPVDEAEMGVLACRESFRRSGMNPADIDAVVVGWSEHRYCNRVQQWVAVQVAR